MQTFAPFAPLRTASAVRWWHAAPPVCALTYPYLLKGFNLTLSSGAMLPALLLALAFSIPLIGFLAALDLGGVAHPDSSQILAKRLAWLAVAAPPIYTADGVLLYMAGDPVADTTVWLAMWIVLSLAGLAAVKRTALARVKSHATASATVSSGLRVAHGASALAIVLLFLAMHLSDHLSGLVSEAQHRHLMDLFRIVYRAHLVEPLIVLLFLFQVMSGLGLLRAHSARPADFYRSLQLASGAYLVFFILAHMNSVFYYARSFAGIKTDWDFATGAPTGLIHDAWNIRLVPHYGLGVFLVLTHLVLGARIVALGHGVERRRANAWSNAGIAAAALLALLIMLGMSGLHLSG